MLSINKLCMAIYNNKHYIMTHNQIKYLKMVNNLPKKERKKELKWFYKNIVKDIKNPPLQKTSMAV